MLHAFCNEYLGLFVASAIQSIVFTTGKWIHHAAETSLQRGFQKTRRSSVEDK
jgi:hypothetical protein